MIWVSKPWYYVELLWLAAIVQPIYLDRDPLRCISVSLDRDPLIVYLPNSLNVKSFF